MNTSFQKAYEKLERQRQQIIDMIKDLTVDVYTASLPGKWSIAQIITHLLTAERLSGTYMKKKSLGIGTLADSGLQQRILSVILKLSQRMPFLRYTAPRVIVENTPETLLLEEALAQWSKSRNELKRFLETISDKHSRRLIYKHPIAGMLNAEQALKFMYEHVNHHLPQIKRLLKR